jgi:hypothetical protein
MSPSFTAQRCSCGGAFCGTRTVARHCSNRVLRNALLAAELRMQTTEKHHSC